MINLLKWCRWPDSNRHGFRHCPLKTACLPDSTTSALSAHYRKTRQILLRNFSGWAQFRFRFRNNRLFRNAGFGKSLLGFRYGNLPHEALLGWCGLDDPRQRQAVDEKQGNYDGGNPAEKGCTSACAENRTGGAAAECCAGIRAPAVLQQHQADDAQRQQDRGDEKDGVHAPIFARPGRWPGIRRPSGKHRRLGRRRYPAWRTTPTRWPP